MIGTVFQLLRRLDIHLAKAYFPTTPSKFETLVASLGHTPFCVLVLATTEACVVVFGGENGVRVALINTISIGLTFLVSQAVKSLAFRLRPHEDLPHVMPVIKAPDKYSFPSSHAAGTFCTATSIGSFYRGVIPLVFLIAFAISFSRFIARLHYPSDILVGAMIGTSVALAVSRISQLVLFG